MRTYKKNSYSNRRSYGNSGYSRRKKKRSGARFSNIRKGKMAGERMISGWKVVNRDLLLVSAFPTADYGETQNGKKFRQYLVKVQHGKYAPEVLHTGFEYEESKGSIYIPGIDIKLNPNANNGGYCGSYRQKRR